MVAVGSLAKTLVGSIVAVFLATATGSAQTRYEVVPSDGGNFVLVSGKFSANDSIEAFVDIVHRSGASAVSFNSPGGNVQSAMRLGRAIRMLGLQTIQIKQLECASACALTFLGGTERIADPGSIGVHQSSFSPEADFAADEAVAAIQAGTADIMDYLAEMGVDAGVLRLALRYDRSDMRYLSASEMAEFRVTTTLMSAYASPPRVASPQAVTPNAERLASEFVHTVLSAHSADNATALATVLVSYADQVAYYGKETGLGAVVKDKRDYFARWPERAYRIDDNSVRVSCRENLCEVSGVDTWFVRSMPRNKQASGAATFSYNVEVSDRLRIIGESSEVIGR